MDKPYLLIENQNGKPVKAWVKGVPFDPGTEQQLLEAASMPFIHHHVAAMPTAMWGRAVP